MTGVIGALGGVERQHVVAIEGKCRLSRSYGLEMIGFPIVYWGVLHDESSFYSKSTPIKKGLFIPLQDKPWMFAWCAHFHPLPLLTSNTVAFSGISTTCAACTYLYLRVPTHAVCVSYLSRARGFAFFMCTLVRVCAPAVGTCVSMVVSLNVDRVVLLCLCQEPHVCNACYMKKGGLWSPVPELVNSFALIPLPVSPQSPF
ncbi:hypothetical protein GOODEAATRI_013121 [Goodea atripinnis]|uniref:Uncharacterized protein n=1 Tax=Goodea atripinnis TaxID=208336 RepID=A0ABV0PXL8_9TELE